MMASSKMTVLPEPVGEETTMFSSECIACRDGVRMSLKTGAVKPGATYCFEALALNGIEDAKFKKAPVPVGCQAEGLVLESKGELWREKERKRATDAAR